MEIDTLIHYDLLKIGIFKVWCLDRNIFFMIKLSILNKGNMPQKIKFRRNEYGDYNIICNDENIGMIEFNANYNRYKYEIYINNYGKVVNQGYDVFNFQTAKKVTIDFINKNNRIIKWI